MAIIKKPSQIRPRELGSTKFATGRANLNASVPNPTCPGKSMHMRHEMREHRRGKY